MYQGRFKSFPIAEDDHYFQVVCYVERNALRANLAPRAEAWRWGSLWRQVRKEALPEIALAEGRGAAGVAGGLERARE